MFAIFYSLFKKKKTMNFTVLNEEFAFGMWKIKKKTKTFVNGENSSIVYSLTPR